MAEILNFFKIQPHIRIPHPQISLGGNFQVLSSILIFQPFLAILAIFEWPKMAIKIKIRPTKNIYTPTIVPNDVRNTRKLE